MTRSSNKGLVTTYEELEQVLHSTRKLFKTMSLDYSSSLEFDLFSDHEDQFEEEVTETMGEPTMVEYMTKIREDYGSRIARPKFDEKARFELKGQFFKVLRDNAFSGTTREDVVEHIENFLKIVDSLDISNITEDQCMLRIFPILLNRVASRWIRNKPVGSITTWEILKGKFLRKYYPSGCTVKKMEENHNFQQESDMLAFISHTHYMKLMKRF
ncbi:hypothetical protein Tco_1568145 [Tanacetum coccineum]